MASIFNHASDSEAIKFKKEVEAILLRNEGETDISVFDLVTSPNGFPLLRLKYDLTQFTKDEITALFNRMFPGGLISDTFQL